MAYDCDKCVWGHKHNKGDGLLRCSERREDGTMCHDGECFMPIPDKEYEFIGSWAQYGFSLSRVSRHNPCLSELQRYIDYLTDYHLPTDTVFTSWGELSELRVMRDNIPWLLSHNVIKAVEKCQCPWKPTEFMPSDRRGTTWLSKEHQWFKDALRDFCLQKAEQLGRTPGAIQCKVRAIINDVY